MLAPSVVGGDETERKVGGGFDLGKGVLVERLWKGGSTETALEKWLERSGSRRAVRIRKSGAPEARPIQLSSVVLDPPF